MSALMMARAETDRVTPELRVAKDMRSKLPPCTHFFFNPRDKVRVHSAQERRWSSPVKVVRKIGKEVTVTDGIKFCDIWHKSSHNMYGRRPG